MARTRVKICGLTREQDLRAAIELGADAVGLVFCVGSPRHLELAAARELRERVPAFVTTVALLLDPTADAVNAVIDAVRPDLLQFHGSEEAAFCESFDRPYIKAIPMAPGADLAKISGAHPQARALLLDSHAKGAMGGTGSRFDWTLIQDIGRPLVLAGGLDPDNVAEAIRDHAPWAVDVSSGVESEPGIKSAAKMERFFQEIARVQR